jgi:cysteine desulfurase
MKRRIYFDNAATTAISPSAAQALAKSIIDLGNPSSLHGFGREVRLHLENAREEIASALGALASEVIFTGSGTEANNTAIKGLFWHRGGRNVIITTSIEHHAILDPIQWLVDHEGTQVRYLKVDRAGVIDLDNLQQLIAEEGEKIAFISFLHTNNELGTVQDLESIARVTGEHR